MKKKLLALLMAGVMAMGITGCGGGEESADSGEKTKLYVVNWKDYGSDDETFIEEFEAAYNCEVVNTFMDSEEDLLTRLKTSGEGEIDEIGRAHV